MVKAAAAGWRTHSMAGTGMGWAHRTAVWLRLYKSRKAAPLGPADTATEVCSQQSGTRLKQGDWGQEDTGVLAGAHLAPFWVTQLANDRNERGRNI